MFKKKMVAFMVTIVTASGMVNAAAPEQQARAASSPNCSFRFCVYEDIDWDGWRRTANGTSGAVNIPWIDTNEVTSVAWDSAGTYILFDSDNQQGDWAKWRFNGQSAADYVGGFMNDRTNSYSWGPY